MQRSRKFSKYHGAGNDFILFEDFEEDFPIHKIPELCAHSTGIGSDGLILARDSRIANYQMVYFNKDGSEGAMCGNGLRCFVHFLIDLGKKNPLYKIEIQNQVLTVKVDRFKISTFLAPARVMKWGVCSFDEEIYLVDTGVLHAVIFAREGCNVLSQAELIRHDKKLHPSGVNVNFVWEKGEDALEVRTYEKGVEAETLACGTGAAAAAFVAHKLGKTGPNVLVHTASKAILDIRLKEEIEVRGPSTKVFEGQIIV